ncbi:hypothetical protein QE152_g35685 [Popillia japonica]|uniref:Retrovirus-related Pol polyprotein from transposon TNT 1-94 n=1 Tax=Popillia japonica TaxID=7064 RepID=A0AAW1IF62_POPJA
MRFSCLDQSSYINEILKRFKVSECTPKSTPSDINVKLSLSMYPQSDEDRKKVSECTPKSTPSDINVKLSLSMYPQSDEDRKKVLKIPYQEAVGR